MIHTFFHFPRFRPLFTWIDKHERAQANNDHFFTHGVAA